MSHDLADHCNRVLGATRTHSKDATVHAPVLIHELVQKADSPKPDREVATWPTTATEFFVQLEPTVRMPQYTPRLLYMS
jgi:hypothetical protein